MTTNGLRRHYPGLDAARRAALALDAAARGDGVELARVGAAAGRVAVEVADTAFPGLALLLLAGEDRARRHELAQIYDRLLAAAAFAESAAERRAYRSARAVATLLAARADGWGLFAAGRGLTEGAAGLLAPPSRLLAETEADARALTLPPAEAAAALADPRAGEPAVEMVLTPEAAAAALDARYADWLAVWEGAAG